jgi:hypothetical protein
MGFSGGCESGTGTLAKNLRYQNGWRYAAVSLRSSNVTHNEILVASRRSRFGTAVVRARHPARDERMFPDGSLPGDLKHGRVVIGSTPGSMDNDRQVPRR